MTTSYKQIENPPTTNGVNGSSQSTQAPSLVAAPPKKKLKSWSTLKTLVWIELALSIGMFAFEATCSGTIDFSSSLQDLGRNMSAKGTGMGVGILGGISVWAGFPAFFWSIHGVPVAVVIKFFMSSICAMADCVMIHFAWINLWVLHDAIGEEARQQTVAVICGLFALELVLLLAAVTHLVCNVVSAILICRNWCYGYHPAVLCDSQPSK